MSKPTKAKVNVDASLKSYIPKVKKHYYFPPIHEDICDDIGDNQSVILTGHTGTGKSSLFVQIAASQSQPVLRVPFNGTMTPSDLLGFMNLENATTKWVDGVLPFCMRNGIWLIAEEIDFGDPPILAPINIVLEDDDQKLVLKENGHEVIVPHENFRFLATANTIGVMSDFRNLYQGTNVLNEAFLDRSSVYHIEYMPPDEEVKVLMADVEGMTEESAESLVDLANELRDDFKKELVEFSFGYRKLKRMGKMFVRKRNYLDNNPEEFGYSPLNAIFEAINRSLFGHISLADAEFVADLVQKKFADVDV